MSSFLNLLQSLYLAARQCMRFGLWGSILPPLSSARLELRRVA